MGGKKKNMPDHQAGGGGALVFGAGESSRGMGKRVRSRSREGGVSRTRIPVVSIVLFVLAAGLLLFGSVGGARAALAYYSENYTSQFEMYQIGITLNENGTAISKRNYTDNGTWEETGGALLDRELEEGGGIILGKQYDESLTVTNSGDIDEYVRVSIYKYWCDRDADGNVTQKYPDLSPATIQLNLLCDATGSDNGWILDEKETNSEYIAADRENPGTCGEKTVLYYNTVLQPSETSADKSTSTPFADKVSIDGALASYVSQTKEVNGEYTTITSTYEYDGKTFCIEVQADGVQTHNAADAILSAWGREVTISDNDTLYLK